MRIDGRRREFCAYHAIQQVKVRVWIRLKRAQFGRVDQES